ncbi:hypothetical protein CWB96_11435 [Pseudoalteromonas citrea]|uniref:Xaa-Pro dipeptidyl-peptidase C-terminal domain-containing protein n=1 Tax=Pseudoalteromonas citrea TaxID=43655 RepID=A0A5S3XNS9_9GAMM|nr:CocE/NonD family hydrolase [Pseudoalteromonas citrea]TMP42403.1 hypothetical protein CWB97_11805 [Pseudoalteromonas citrea]TMP58778.1 hypothetical protein CWB96_11435 [Pseudoalteromonas citrea]
MRLPYLTLYSIMASLFISFTSFAMTDEIDFTWHQKIELRDGKYASATIYKPLDSNNALPSIVFITPYNRDEANKYGTYFARHGYAFIAVDSRGRGDSDGEFIPFEKDGQDGFDVIEWVAAQPWSNQKVAMMGGSYRGFTQWATLKEAPPSLKTIVPTASVYPAIDFPYKNDIPTYYVMSWLHFISGKTNNSARFNQAHVEPIYAKLRRDGASFRELDQRLGNPSSIFQKWLDHPEYDDYWENMVPQAQHYRAFTGPVLSITGQYDGDHLGTLNYYKNLMAATQNKKDHYLILGPWDHAGTRSPKSNIDGVLVGNNSLLDFKKLHLEWFNWTLKGAKKPGFLKDNIATFNIGSNRWHYYRDLQSLDLPNQRFNLSSTHKQHNVFSSGLMTSSNALSAAPYSEYQYDPLHTQGMPKSTEHSLTGQNTAMAIDNNGVIFHSHKLKQALFLQGQISLSLWLSSNIANTDLYAMLYIIDKHGNSELISEDLVRLNRGANRDHNPNELYQIKLDSFALVSRRLPKNSRLRLVVTSEHSRYQKHYNGDGPVAAQTGLDAIPATMQIHHQGKYQSSLNLPLSHSL